MKRLSLYALTLLALIGFAACTEDYKDWADPQSNPEEDKVSITFSATNTATTVFDLNTITADAIEVAVSNLTGPEGTTTTYEVQVAKDETFADKRTLDATAEGNVLSISTAALQDVMVEMFGKRPDQHTLKMRVNGYVTTAAGQTSLARSGIMEVKITTQAPVIESAYYFIGTATGWNIGDLEAFKFSHSGNDVYDDPKFTLYIHLPEPETGTFESKFKIVPESSKVAADWAGVFGTVDGGSKETEGPLVTDNGKDIEILESGLYRITIDMMECTYKIERLGTYMPQEAYYLVGDVTGWNGSDVSTLLKFDHSGKNVAEDPYFTLTIKSAGNSCWKLVPQSVYDAVSSGEMPDIWGGAMGVETDGDPASEGFLSADFSGAAKIADVGWAKITLNMTENTYSVELLGDATPLPTSMFMIGSPWDWSWDKVGDSMTPIHSHPGKFWAMQYFSAGDQIKFCTVKAWSGDFGYGGATIPDASIAYADVSSSNDGNIVIGKAGWYLMVVTADYTDESQTTFGYTVEFLEPTVWLVGGASNGGWDAINENEADKFSVPAAGDGEFVSPAFVAGAELRLSIKIEGVEWWQTEFMIFNGKIEYRGTGDDQARVNVNTGGKAYLNFSDNTGRVE